jgi:hypothetical protein
MINFLQEKAEIFSYVIIKKLWETTGQENAEGISS